MPVEIPLTHTDTGAKLTWTLLSWLLVMKPILNYYCQAIQVTAQFDS